MSSSRRAAIWIQLSLFMVVLKPQQLAAFRLVFFRRLSARPIMGMLDSTSSSSNQEIAERHDMEATRQRRTTVNQQNVEKAAQRNSEVKRMLQTAPDPQDFYQVKLTACEELRQELKLTGREKRGRVFIEKDDNDAVSSIRGLKRELHGFFRALRKNTYVLSAGYPAVDQDGKVTASLLDGKNISTSLFWPIKTDDDVVTTFDRADLFFVACDALKRPAIVILVSKDPNALPPPPPPAYLENMADPAETTHMTMLSFYSFPKHGIADPDDFSVQLRRIWKPFQVLGRVYVAKEGVNAQMSCPTNVLDNFIECCRSLPEAVGKHLENGINVDAVPLTREEYAIAGVPGTAGKPAPPFKNLHIRVRQQVVADGLNKPYDWQSAGYDMPALEWHERLKEEKERRESGSGQGITLLDCRNSYETDVGIFEGAEPLETQNFRDSWDVLKEKLADKPRDAPIMTYCTGGIRCVKVGAYLTQELGFTNVSRLAGGIIAYDRTLTENAPEETPLFKGTNFVFDGRLGRPITEDALGSCLTCGAETSMVSNCRNDNCHRRMIQCENCRTSYSGTCSDACRHRLVNGAMRPRRPSTSDGSAATAAETKAEEVLSSNFKPQFKTLDEYSTGHSSPPPCVYPEMELNTRALIPTGSHMVSGRAQGRLLTQLASMTRGGRVLELGTFTGYATACLLEGAANAGRAIAAGDTASSSASTRNIGSREGGPFVMTMERDQKSYDVAAAQLKIIAEHGTGEAAAEAMCALRSSTEAVPVISEDSVSIEYDGVAGCELVKVTDALAIVEAMAAGLGDLQPAPFDMVFLDADKTRLLEYAEALLSSDRVLKKGGLIVVDNVLWKGLVLEASSGDFSSLQEDRNSDEEELRKNRRARKLANKMHRFNRDVVNDNRVEVLVLPMRDGLSIIRKK